MFENAFLGRMVKLAGLVLAVWILAGASIAPIGHGILYFQGALDASRAAATGEQTPEVVSRVKAHYDAAKARREAGLSGDLNPVGLRARRPVRTDRPCTDLKLLNVDDFGIETWSCIRG